MEGMMVFLVLILPAVNVAGVGCTGINQLTVLTCDNSFLPSTSIFFSHTKEDHPSL
ncbi:hypothetical protein BC941DRAFT_509230 [Chlamydoabsidia padenii]|nr:hypothetical protein BC941DRAFT_509230 [Chlamydoabsidia padenii]